MWSGQHPVTRSPLGLVKPLTLSTWRTLSPAQGAAPAAVESLKRPYLDLVMAELPKPVHIPANATVGGVPISRLSEKTADPYFRIQDLEDGRPAPCMPTFNILCDDESSGEDTMSDGS